MNPEIDKMEMVEPAAIKAWTEGRTIYIELPDGRIIGFPADRFKLLSKATDDQLKEVKGRDLTEESALLETKKAAARGIKVSVIYIAGKDEPSSAFIKNIAQAGKGRVFRIGNLSDLKAFLH